MHCPPARIAALSAFGLLTMLSGCGGGSGGSGSTTSTSTSTQPSSTPADSFYVNTVNDAFYPPQPSSILQFSRTANGATSPVATVTGPADTIFGAMSIDAAGNLYVAGQIPGDSSNPSSPAALSKTEILVYAPGARGTATPTQIVTVGGLFNNSIAGMDVDPAGNLYLSTSIAIGSGPSGRVYLGVAVYSTSGGTLALSRSIAGDSTGIRGNAPLAVDASGNTFIAGGQYGSSPQSVLIFGPTATGDVAPDAVISGSNTGIGMIGGLAVDRSGNLYVTSGGTILEFASGATGNVAPIRTISVTDATPNTIGGSIRVDASGNIYVFGLETGAVQSILVYAPTATGSATPAATITASAYDLPGFGLALER